MYTTNKETNKDVLLMLLRTKGVYVFKKNVYSHAL